MIGGELEVIVDRVRVRIYNRNDGLCTKSDGIYNKR